MTTQTTQLYDPQKLDKIKRILQSAAEKGNPEYYEIYVDDLKVVRHTNDVADFDRYEQFIDNSTVKVVVYIYGISSNSRYGTEYVFTMKEIPQQNNILQGIELENSINQQVNVKVSERVAAERERWDCEQVKKELADTKEKLTEAEEYIGKLQTMMQETKGKLHQAEGLGDLTGILKDFVIPTVLGKYVPQKESLSGSENPSAGASAKAGKPEEEASFTKTSSEEKPSLSQQEKNFIEFGKSIHSSFSQGEFSKLLSIIDAFAKDKTAIDPVMSLLNIENKQSRNSSHRRQLNFNF